MQDQSSLNHPDTPPLPENENGQTRRVGVEIEFAGLKVAEAARLVQQQFDGRIKQSGNYRTTIGSPEFGPFTVELDTQYAHTKGDGDVERALADAAGAVGELFVPVEIVSPPLPYTRLQAMDKLVEDIRRHGAEGTGAGLFSAFGCHLNPEVARTDTAFITDHLKAYLILSAWLRHTINLDVTRQITPFVDPFPASYARRVVDPDYAPGLGQLIDDYLRDNPTRNRELDMLPLFAFLDEDRVRALLDDPRIKPRPTFHYRLPNSRVDEPHWTVTREWRRWLSVERLATDPDRLREACRAFCDFHDQTIPLGWAREAEKWA